MPNKKANNKATETQEAAFAAWAREMESTIIESIEGITGIKHIIRAFECTGDYGSSYNPRYRNQLGGVDRKAEEVLAVAATSLETIIANLTKSISEI